ncbi:hypothetical protein R1flu_025130 [Riccia fluitans]|uniref:RING-CH-type domain-containing protein n=1 Tax=Riccia fluitans TaxID=41844 RepID=A0ABD1Y105_9MARC
MNAAAAGATNACLSGKVRFDYRKKRRPYLAAVGKLTTGIRIRKQREEEDEPRLPRRIDQPNNECTYGRLISGIDWTDPEAQASAAWVSGKSSEGNESGKKKNKAVREREISCWARNVHSISVAMAAAPEEHTQSSVPSLASASSSSGRSKPEQVSGDSSGKGQGLRSDGKNLQALVTRASDGSGVELAAESSSSPSSAGGHSAESSTSSAAAGTVVRVVTESGTEIVPRGSTSAAEGSKQITHFLLTSATPPVLPDFASKAKSEAGKNKTIVVGDGDFEDVDLEKGLNFPAKVPAAGVEKNDGRKDTAGAVYDEYEAGEEPVCRVCQVNLGPKESLMDLGCACKRDLAHAHQECAETWFRVRGNRKCEICGEIAQNVHLVEVPAGTSTENTTTITVVTVHHRYACQNRPVRVLLAFLIAAFLVPWLFRFAYRQ